MDWTSNMLLEIQTLLHLNFLQAKTISIIAISTVAISFMASTMNYFIGKRSYEKITKLIVLQDSIYTVIKEDGKFTLDKEINLPLFTNFFIYIFNSHLFKAILKYFENNTDNKTKSKEDIAIASYLVLDKAKQSTYIYLSLINVFIFYFLISYFHIVNVNRWFLVLLICILFAQYINQKILAYRVSEGLYGNNEFEAREIIKFILENNDKINGSGTKLFPDPSVKKSYSIIPKGLGEIYGK